MDGVVVVNDLLIANAGSGRKGTRRGVDCVAIAIAEYSKKKII